jgi:hypothetical protein
MKYAMMLLLLLTGLISKAAVLEVNKEESKVYYTVTPTLQLSLVDLDGDGGMLTVFLDYRGGDIRKESEQLYAQYPNHIIQAVVAQPVSETVDLEIAQLGLKQTLKVSQGQTGTYLNAQVMLTTSQVLKLRGLRNDLKNQVRFQLPVRASYFSTQVLESVNLDDGICGGDKVKSLKDVILNLSNLKKPDAVKNERTFSSLKQDMLDKCYGITPSQVNSFAGLMKQQIVQQHPGQITGKYADSVQQSNTSVLSVNYELQLN